MLRNGISEFKSLAKAAELDTDWFRSVTALLPKFAINGSIVPVDSPYSNGHQTSGSISDSTYPCSQCGMVTPSRSRHVLNSCERLKDRYNWRRENLLNYIDSLMDHNTFKVFCNLKDRRTTTGGTIPKNIQPSTGDLVDWKDMVPDLVAIDRLSDEVFIFVISVPHETEIEDAHASQLNKYHQALLTMRRSFNCTVNFHAFEIGSASGYINNRTNSAIFELHKLTVGRQPPMERFVHNLSQLAKLGSYKIFKTRHETKNWNMNYLHPETGNRVFTATKRTILNRYVYPLARAGGCIVAIIFLIFLLYLSCLFLHGIWLMLTSQVLVFVFLGIVVLCLQIFRP